MSGLVDAMLGKHVRCEFDSNASDVSWASASESWNDMHTPVVVSLQTPLARSAMVLKTIRLGATPKEPLSLEVASQLAPASALLLHLERLSGLKVLAKKSWAMTDDFEAYFLYKGRLFVMETPMVNVWVSLIGQPADEALFREVEAQIQSFSAWFYFLAPVAIAKYFFTPFNPSRTLLAQHEGAARMPQPGGGAS
jgi:hypothetical protein